MAVIVPEALPQGDAAQPAVQLPVHSLIESFWPDYYGLLGANIHATASSIHRCWRQRSAKEHPDKGGDMERFKALATAKDVLCEEQKRTIYDELSVLVRGGYELMSFIETHSSEDELWELWQCCRTSLQDSIGFLAGKDNPVLARGRLQEAQIYMDDLHTLARELQDRPHIEFDEEVGRSEGHYVVRNADREYTTVCIWSQLRRSSGRGRAGRRNYVLNDTPIEIIEQQYLTFEKDYYVAVRVTQTQVEGFVKAHHVHFVITQHASEQTRERSRSPRCRGGCGEGEGGEGGAAEA